RCRLSATTKSPSVEPMTCPQSDGATIGELICLRMIAESAQVLPLATVCARVTLSRYASLQARLQRRLLPAYRGACLSGAEIPVDPQTPPRNRHCRGGRFCHPAAGQRRRYPARAHTRVRAEVKDRNALR